MAVFGEVKLYFYTTPLLAAPANCNLKENLCALLAGLPVASNQAHDNCLPVAYGLWSPEDSKRERSRLASGERVRWWVGEQRTGC